MLQRQVNFEKQEKRSTTDEEDDESENEDSFVEHERLSLVVPAYHSYADIEQLELESVYLVEVNIHFINSFKQLNRSLISFLFNVRT